MYSVILETLGVRFGFSGARVWASLGALTLASLALPGVLAQMQNFYTPTAGSGPNLTLASGTTVCDETQVSYSGGAIALAASATNYVYLDQSNSCAPSSNTTGLTDAGIPIAVATTNATSVTSITDLRTWSAGGNNITYNAARFPGADAGAKIMAAHDALPNTGGSIDARGFTAPTTTTTLLLTKPVHLIFGHYAYTYNGTSDMIRIPTAATGTIIIEGQGSSLGSGNLGTTVLVNNSPTGHGINCQMSYVNGKFILRNLEITSSLTSPSQRVYGNGVNIDYGDNFTSTRYWIQDVKVSFHVFGIRAVQGIQGAIVDSNPAGNSVDGIRVEGGTSGNWDTDYAQNQLRDNFSLTTEYHAIPYWRANSSFPSGTFVVSFAGTAGGHIFKSGGGASGGTEPTWNTGVGATTTDGGITWTESGILPYTPVNQSGMIPVWQPGIAYSLNQVVAPFLSTTYPTKHFYKVTVAGTSSTIEPVNTATITSISKNATTGVVSCSVSSISANVTSGLRVAVTGTTNYNGNYVISSASGTTITFNGTVGSPGAEAAGTITTQGWPITGAATVTDNGVTWKEIGLTPTAAFGPNYSTIRNTASDFPVRYNYEFYGPLDLTITSPGAEAAQDVSFHFLNGGEIVLTTPYMNANSANNADGILAEGVIDFTLMGGQGSNGGGTRAGWALDFQNISGRNVTSVRIIGGTFNGGWTYGIFNDPNNVVEYFDLPSGVNSNNGSFRVKSNLQLGTHMQQNATNGDLAFTITLAGGTARKTFATAFASVPVVTCSNQSNQNPLKVSPTVSNVTVTSVGTTDVVACVVVGNPK